MRALKTSDSEVMIAMSYSIFRSLLDLAKSANPL